MSAKLRIQLGVQHLAHTKQKHPQTHNSHQKNSKLEQNAEAWQGSPTLLFQQNKQEGKTTVVKRNCWLMDFFKITICMLS